jgi:hypothetical protein
MQISKNDSVAANRYEFAGEHLSLLVARNKYAKQDMIILS